ncbi:MULTISPECIES: MOSC domain-containing protein [Micromonosporaceae]|uniref:MOSC domain-containing protein n=1 Tax=Micromonosporaceae TaxID=28056 RepID=UPI00249A8728|nr:MOSC N-terminal beta barrel domain-containing protein [Solwaraspora sp. WMMD937]WFE21991.1 MOSC N-terminal beta barrel domain-containing protein [Solwaraspora sp. WMMD937]
MGRVRQLSRYPVKSMLGEDLDQAYVDEAGIAGDRAFAVLDCLTGKVASAKNPRLWRDMLTVRSTLTPPGSTGAPAVRLTMADGTTETATVTGHRDPALSKLLGRDVRLIDRAAPGACIERMDPTQVRTEDDLRRAETGSSGLAAGSPPGTFFDFAPLHLITTATLAGLATHSGRPVHGQRFRPNIVVEVPDANAGFVENLWPGRRLRIGPDVVAEVVIPTPRCVVPALRHGDDEPDIALLQVLSRHNRLQAVGSLPCAGVYARPLEFGVIRSDDPVEFC